MKYVKCVKSPTLETTINKIYKHKVEDKKYKWFNNDKCWDWYTDNSAYQFSRFFIDSTEQEYNKQEGIINKPNYYFY